MDSLPEDEREDVHGAQMKRGPDVYRDCAARGLSKSETARELGVSPQAVDDMAVRHGIAFRDGRDRA